MELTMLKRSFETVEDAYKELTPALIRYATSHLYAPDHALDCVHDAFEKVSFYNKKHPERKILTRIIYWQVLIATKKYNKYANELILDDEPFPETDL